MRKFIIIIFAIFNLIAFNLHSEDIGSIYSVSYPNLLEINFGPCFVGDSLVSEFNLENNSNRNFYVNPVTPSFAISRSPLEIITDEFRSFRSFQNIFPMNIPPQSNSKLKIQYKADSNLVIFPLGWYNALLEIGFTDQADTGVVVHKIFDIKAKKTRKYIDGFEDVLSFDSIYVNPPIPLEKIWRVKSTNKDSITLSTQKFTLLTQQLTPDEFDAKMFSINPTFRKRDDIINWTIAYKPLDIGTDSGLVELSYKPLPELFPDSIQTAEVLTVGTGVKQDLKLIGADFSISGDTIFVGNQQTNKIFKIEANIYNNGNIPFGSISEELLSDNMTFDYDIITKLAEFNHLKPKDTSSFTAEVTLKELGNFTLKYQLESDISVRNILFVPFDAKFKTIYIVGQAVEPVIQTLSDTVDFENVYHYLPYCESSKDTTIMIRNIGNDTLRISKIEIINQVPNFSFTSDNPEIKISPNGKKSILINFEPTLAMNYSADLVIHNNSAKSPYIIHLMGSSTTPAITGIHIDTIYGKPGSIVLVPIIVDSNIVFANEFTDSLFYNRSILHYAGYITENTASTLPIEMIEVEESVEGKLFVHIKKHEKTRFSNVKKLIILQFKAFLGNAVSTEISFMNPRFSNEICEYALNLPSGNVRNGTFITDSICGIDLKAYPKKIIINSLYPNPIVKELKADFVCLEETNLSFTLYNTLGDIVYSAESKLYPVGEYKEFFDFSFLNYGIYYFKITENNTNFHLQKIIITK